MSRETFRRLRPLAAAVSTAALALGALGIASATAATPRPHAGTAVTKAAALGNNWYAAAPYLMPLDNDPPDAGAVMDATGMKAFQLAFILAPNGGGCTPTWGGTDPVSSDTQAAAVINEIRSRGGDVSVSVGGYGGTKLGQECGTPQATAAAYQQVITTYGLHAIDFDLEEPEYENATDIANELGAAQILQRNNPGLYVSVTTPGTAAGTGWFGTQMLDEAKSLGFTPDNYSIMPFDGGFSGASSQTAALTAFNQILQTTFGWSAATAYAHEGYSGMNGRTDSGEYFYQADFQTVLNYAESNHMARYTFWSVNRDRECDPPDNNGTTSGTCSSVTQNPYDFTKYAVEFAGATPPTSPTQPPTSPPPGGTCTVAAYSGTAIYTNGDEVSYNGHDWTAKWWTQGEAPSTGGSGVWTDDGPC